MSHILVGGGPVGIASPGCFTLIPLRGDPRWDLGSPPPCAPFLRGTLTEVKGAPRGKHHTPHGACA